jgi:hypothetical protein
MLSLGIGLSEMEAESNIKLIATSGKFFETLYAKTANVTVDELLGIMNWEIKPNQLLLLAGNYNKRGVV